MDSSSANLLNDHQSPNTKGITCVTYPDGNAEATTWASMEFGRNKGGKQREAENKDEMSENSKIAASCRAKKVVRQKIATIQADRMLTITYRGCMTDFNKLWRDFKLLLRNLKKRNIKFDYVAVPERHKHGGYHLHIALKGFIMIQIVREEWYHITRREDGKTGGNVDITTPRNKKLWAPINLASYLAKYVTKAMDCVEISRRRYRTSLNINVNKLVKYVHISLSDFYTQRSIESLLGVEFNNNYEYRDGFFWLSTWARKKRFLLPDGEVVWA